MTRSHVLILLAWLAPIAAQAHPLAPTLLQIIEREPGHLEVQWKEPVGSSAGGEMAPWFPDGCKALSAPDIEQVGTGSLYRWEMSCPEESLVGSTLRVTGLAQSRSNVLVRIRLADGREMQEMLSGDRGELIVPAVASPFGVASRYASIGLHHLLTGWDHLLLLLGLLLLIGDLRVLVATVTSFTLGHAITLSLASLGLIRAHQGWVEVAIAFSIVVLAAEILRGLSAKGRRSSAMRGPCTMAILFGLLHGLGFAGGLAAIGLPQSDIPLALFSFNVGIELGQLFWIAILGAAFLLVRRLDFVPWQMIRSVGANGIGTIGAYWLIERSWSLI
jgi:hypothetical protein